MQRCKKTGICGNNFPIFVEIALGAMESGNIFPIFVGIALGAMESRKEDVSNKLVI